MKRIQCIIIDDEPLARELIQTYVNRLEGWEIMKVCSDPSEAYEALYQYDIDVVFLDIQMPVISGIDFLRTLKTPPHIIFTTAYPQHAVDAFELKAVDYLLKPITEERFLQAIAKIKVAETTDNEKEEERKAVFLKQDGKLVKILFDDILYVEAVKDFSKVFLKLTTMLVGNHLKQMEKMLPANKFIRIHRSYMISIHAITALQGNTVEIGKHIIPIGGMYKEELMKQLKLDS